MLRVFGYAVTGHPIGSKRCLSPRPAAKSWWARHRLSGDQVRRWRPGTGTRSGPLPLGRFRRAERARAPMAGGRVEFSNGKVLRPLGNSSVADGPTGPPAARRVGRRGPEKRAARRGNPALPASNRTGRLRRTVLGGLAGNPPPNYHLLRALSWDAPVTRGSDKSRRIVMRKACNIRLRNALYA